MMRTWMIGIALGLVGCAHVDTSRAPANIDASRGLVDPTKDVVGKMVVAEAFILGPGAEPGTRRATCRVNVGGHPELVPTFMRTSSKGSNLSLGVPECDPEERDEIARVAASSSSPNVAGGPALLGLCLIDFGFTAALTASINYTLNKKAPKMKKGDAIITSGIGSVLPAAGMETYRTLPLLRSLGAANLGRIFSIMSVGAVCTTGGLAVGYWLVPLEYAL